MRGYHPRTPVQRYRRALPPRLGAPAVTVRRAIGSVLATVHSRSPAWLALGAVTTLGLLLRLYRIDHQSLWYDEAFSLTVARLPLPDMLAAVLDDHVHPPVYYLVLHSWVGWLGFGALQARLLSAVFGTASIVMLYLLARILTSHRVAIISGALLALSQLGVMYSQEARQYAALLFFVLASLYLGLRATERHDWRLWVAYAVSLSLMIGLHYYGMFIYLVLAGYMLMACYRKKVPLRWALGTLVLPLMPLLAWLWLLLGHSAIGEKPVFTTQPPWFALGPYTLLDTIGRFNNANVYGLLNSSPAWAWWVSAILFSIPAILGLTCYGARSLPERLAWISSGYAILVFSAVVVPIGLAAALAWMGAKYDPRYVIFCIAPYYVLVAKGIASIRLVWLRGGWLVLALLFSVYALRANYTVPYKENYRDALGELAANYRESDCVVFLPFGAPPLEWAIYYGGLKSLRETTPEKLEREDGGCERVWLVTYRRVEWAVQIAEEGERVLERRYEKVKESRYFWVHVSEYRRSAG